MMISNVRIVYVLLFAGSVLTYPGFCSSTSDIPFFRLYQGQENWIVHPFPDEIDSLSGQEIIELQDNSGLTIWFKRHIFKNVCVTGECKMIDLWLFWDGVGNYYGMEIPESEPLTKTDHTAFNAKDYEKLEILLQDTLSILRNMTPEDLTGESVAEDLDEVDGYTGATLLSLEQIVVKDAVYTCHTLWHTVYGPTQTEIREIINNRINHRYLNLLFENDNPNFINWGIESVKRNPQYHPDFYGKILSLIQSEHPFLSQQALNYFQPTRMKEEELQKALVSLLPSLEPIMQNSIVWKLSQVEKSYEDVVFQLLELFENQRLAVGSLSLIFKILKPEHLQEGRIMPILEKLKNHENNFIRNLAEKKFLEIA